MSRSTLLTIDSVANLLLGALLVVFPRSVVTLLGIPDAPSAFYPSILGAVLCGIGIALWIERTSDPTRTSGLGLIGALSINLCGGIVLSLWLVFGQLALPTRGTVILWILVVFLLGLSVAEFFNRNRST